MAYVAYTQLGPGVEPGTPVNEEDYDSELWQYFVNHGNVVIQGGEHDPNVLAARAAGEGYVDPRDEKISSQQDEIEALKAQLAELKGETPDSSGTPEPPAS